MNVSPQIRKLGVDRSAICELLIKHYRKCGTDLKVDGSGIRYVTDLPTGFVGLQGDENANQFVGGDGNDILAGGAGGDTLTGGAGLDTAGQGVDTPVGWFG